MKPFPEAVQKAFPCPSDRHPERPWWVRADGIDTPRYRRASEPKTANDWMVLAVHIVHPTESELARIDAKHPLPRPGFRAGQIWADRAGGSIVVVQCDGGEPYLNGVLCPTGKFIARFPYLIADPACPHLAPWSPVEEK